MPRAVAVTAQLTFRKSSPNLTATMPIHKGIATFAVALTALAGNLKAAENPVQELSLQDCIDLALKHNLDLQVERRNPIRAQYNIDIALAGYYEPTLGLSLQEDYSKGAAQFNPEIGLPVPGQENTTDSFNSSIRGNLPYTGLQYTLIANGSETETSGGGGGGFNSSRGGAAIALTQPLLRNFWIDNQRLGIAQSKNDLRNAELALKRRVMDTITQVEVAYYNLIFTFESLKVQEMALQLAKRSLDETRKRFEVGTVAELETKQTESQVAAREADLLTARRNLDIQQNVLKRLVSDNYVQVHRLEFKPKESLTAEPHVFDVELSWDKGLSDRPDLQQSRIELENMGLQLKYDRNQLFPQLDLFGSYGRNGSGVDIGETYDAIGNGDQPTHRFGATLSIPLGNRAARSRYRSNKVREEQLLLTLKGQEQGIMIEIDNAIKQAASSYDRVQATRKASEYALAALEAEQKKLENGKSTSFVVLQLQNDLTSARSSELRAVADYNNALAELSFREATTLERHQIDWEVAKDVE